MKHRPACRSEGIVGSLESLGERPRQNVERNFDRENAVSDFLIQVAGLLLLCGLVFGGWLRWINPYEATLDTQQKGL